MGYWRFVVEADNWRLLAWGGTLWSGRNVSKEEVFGMIAACLDVDAGSIDFVEKVVDPFHPLQL